MRFLSVTALFGICFLSMIAGCVDMDLNEADIRDEALDEGVSEIRQNIVYCEQYYYPEDDCGGGGGGGGSPPPPPPATNTSASYLDAAARTYLTQVGVPSSYQIGGTLWVTGCTATAYQGAGTFNSGVSSSCTYAPPAGWIILDYTYEVQANWSSRGTYSASLINGSITTTSTQ